MTTFQANLLCKPLLFIPSSSSFRLSPSRSLSTFTPFSLSSPKPPITLCSLNPNHNNAYFTSDSTAEKKRLTRLLADADANPYNARKQSALLIELNKHSPESVIKRFEQGGHMVDARCLVEYIRALELTDSIAEYLPDQESRVPILLQDLKQRASDKQPLHARTVDPKASNKSTTYEKQRVVVIKKGAKQMLEELVEFIKTPEFDAKQVFEELGEFFQNPKVMQVTEEVVELIKNPKFDAKQVMEVVGEFLNNPKAKKKLEEVVEFIKNPEFDAKQAFEAVGEFLKNPKAKQEFEEVVEFDAKQAFEVVGEFLKNPKAKQQLEEVVEFIKSPNFESKRAFEVAMGIFLQQGQFEKVVEMIKDPELDVKGLKQMFEGLGEIFNDPKAKQEFEEGVEFIRNPTKTTGLGGKLRVIFLFLRIYLRAECKRAYKAVFSVFSKLKYYFQILFLAICGRTNV